MFRFASPVMKAAVAAVIGLFVAAQTSEAQFRFSYGSGNYGGTRIGVGIGQPYGGGYYGGRGYGNYGIYGAPYNYGPSIYGYSSPYYYSDPGYIYSPAINYAPAPLSYQQSLYPPNMQQTPQDNSASIQVICPPNAELTFNGNKTQQTGSTRWFQTPPLSDGTGSYELRATWTDPTSGQPVTQTRTVQVSPNQQSVVNFMNGSK